MTDPRFSFTATLSSEQVSGLSGHARLGVLSCPHGQVATPNFIFCGTRATVKAVPSHRLKMLGTQFVLSNTYHLLLQPGAELVERMGGLHKFMGYDGPMLTDSGGYQIFAMGHGSVSEEIKRVSRYQKKPLTKITEEGCWFKSYIDGKKVFLTPEKSIEIQKQLGADFIVQLDECTPYHISYRRTKSSTELSARWGDRSLAQLDKMGDGSQVMYGVIQGGVYRDLRKFSTDYVINRPFFGIAVGGSLGKEKEEMYQVVASTMDMVREAGEVGTSKPVHLLGIGDLPDIFYGVRQGIDTFDCVIPTRLARHGSAIVPAALNPEGKTRINLKNHRFKYDDTPLQNGFPEHQCYSKAYLNHLIKSREILALEIISEHNIYQMNQLMSDIRKGIKDGSLDEVERYWCG